MIIEVTKDKALFLHPESRYKAKKVYTRVNPGWYIKEKRALDNYTADMYYYYTNISTNEVYIIMDEKMYDKYYSLIREMAIAWVNDTLLFKRILGFVNK